ncbi:MAG: hypothetical protein ACREAA_13055 [Candidatus Polarisedimenticolia bacterium]
MSTFSTQLASHAVVQHAGWLSHTNETHGEQAGSSGPPVWHVEWAQAQGPALLKSAGPPVPGCSGPSPYGPSDVNTSQSMGVTALRGWFV